jgi:hypothetical protein
MAKKQIDEKIQAKFDKPQFREGDAVFFSWIGQKQYGYVTKTKKVSWGIQYTVRNSEKRRYPCGIQISGQRTQYDIGCILFDETKKLTRKELESRIDTPRTFTAVSINTRRSENQSTDDVGSDTTNIGKTNRKTKQSKGTGSSTKNVDIISDTGMPSVNTGKRKNSKTELESAIEKQRNFLNGFIKKD